MTIYAIIIAIITVLVITWGLFFVVCSSVNLWNHPTLEKIAKVLYKGSI